MGIGSPSPQPSQPPLSEEEKKRIEEKKKIDSQRANIFREMLKELYRIKDNIPIELAVEKEKCGRATYVKNYSCTYYCPKCGGGVQQFIENKLVKVINSRNQIYPLYSNNNCLTYENEKDKNSKLKIKDYLSISIKQEENGECYFKINGNKYYMSSYIKDMYIGRKKENDKYPYNFLEIAICNIIGGDLKKEFDEIFHSNWCGTYDYYYCENPYRNNERTKVMKYYRCIKCHFEYHLYMPSNFYYFNFLKLKEKEENKEESGENKQEQEQENQEIKNE